MSNVIVTVVESTTDVTVTEPTVLVDVTENSVEVLSSTAGIQGAKGNDGGLGFYGAFSDYTDQFAGGGTSYANSTANVAYPMRFTTTDESHGVSVVDGDGFQSRITFAYSGVYNLQWSGQFENIDNALHDVSVWLRKGGVDNVVGSNGLVGVPARKSANEPAHIIAGWNFVFSVMAGDYYEFMWSSNSTNVSIQTYPVSTVPTRPSTASLVLTVTQVMNNALPSGTLAVVSPITNTGTSANAVVGLDQTALSITQSQVSGLVSALAGKASTTHAATHASAGTDAVTLAQSQITNLVTDLAGKANLAGGNAFTGTQQIDTGHLFVNSNNNTNGIQFPAGTGFNYITANSNDLNIRPRFDTIHGPADSSGRLRPGNDNTSDLGTSGQRWRNVYSSGLITTNSNAANVVAIVKGASGQTADLQQWQSSTGTILSLVNSAGSFRVASIGAIASGNAALTPGGDTNGFLLATVNAGNKGLSIRGAASQTANLFELQNSAANILASFDSSGQLRVPAILNNNSFNNSRVRVLDAGLIIDTGVAANVALTVQNTNAAPTGDIFRVLGNAGTFQITAAGGVRSAINTGNAFGGGTSANNILAVRANVATNVPLIVSGAASQTANLQEWQNSAGTILAKVDSLGDITARVQRSTFAARFTTTDPSVAIQVNTGVTGQTADFFQTQTSTGTVMQRLTSAGLIRAADNVIANALVGASGSSDTAVTTSLVRIQANSTLGGGWFQATRLTSAPGSITTDSGQIYFRAGTNAGTLKLVVKAGAGAEQTILDNIPQ